jgi:hypothetical protein
MSALYEWTSRLLFPTGAGGPCDPPPPAEAKSYCSPCCTPPPQAFQGEGCYWARAGWRTLSVALEETPSLPTDPRTCSLSLFGE